MKRWGRELDHVVSVRFDSELLASMRQLAKAGDVSVSDWIREAAARLDHASLATSGRFTQRQAAQVLAGLADTIGNDDPVSHHHQTVLRIDEHAAAFEPGLF